ncbi:MAG: substrate-binding domain-containing protein [Deltaproteobacteria bacterium]|jgi:phosphate transport system substrate-binding protein|nr:substrate-binding domain-containing protein [Deltaproteobacteria bacterium]
MKRKSEVILLSAATLFIWLLAGYVLHKYEYLTAFSDIDNIAGMIPVAMVITAALGITVILWKKQTKQNIPMTSATALFVILSVVLFHKALQVNWWTYKTAPNDTQAKPNLTEYAPFSETSKTAKLEEESDLRLIEDLPVLDGATALYPVYAAFAEAAYDKNVFLPDDVLCTNTQNAYEAIMSLERDIIFVAGPSDQQIAEAKAVGADLRFTPIGHEAFVFIVGKKNPINDITYQQIRNIYSGKTAYWRTLGWPDGSKIIAFQRPEGSGSQTGLQKIMGELPIQVPQPLPDESLIGTNSLMKQVSVEWQGVQPAIGYSYRYYATVMYANPEAKLLKVNGIEPSAENIQNGSYPFAGDFYAVTNGEPEGNTKLLINWILSQQGQKIIEKTGYIPLITTEKNTSK